MQIGKEMAIPSILKIGNGTLFEGGESGPGRIIFRQRID